METREVKTTIIIDGLTEQRYLMFCQPAYCLKKHNKTADKISELTDKKDESTDKKYEPI
ncbi:MAG: hypothetical protein II199_02705 [Bacteroidaceae bacterium]|nr:hypothetical protein [Bacteroidaceae bacterium]